MYLEPFDDPCFGWKGLTVKNRGFTCWVLGMEVWLTVDFGFHHIWKYEPPGNDHSHIPYQTKAPFEGMSLNCTNPGAKGGSHVIISERV